MFNSFPRAEGPWLEERLARLGRKAFQISWRHHVRTNSDVMYWPTSRKRWPEPKCPLFPQIGTDANRGPTTLDRKFYPLCQTSVITTQLPHHEAPWRVRAVRSALMGGSGGIVLVGKLKRESDVDRIDRIDTIGTTGRFGKIRTTERACLVWRQRRHSLTGGSLERNRFGQRPSPCIGSDR